MSELRFEWKNMLAADLGEESCVPDLLGERILQNSLKFYLDETDEIYEGYGKVADSYPYRQRNNYTRQLKEKQIRTAVLENDRLKAVFLPDYQGQGFGSFAIQEVMCHLKQRGIKQIILYTDKDNYRAQACYKKCGFRIVESLVETMSNGKDVPRFKMETHWE